MIERERGLPPRHDLGGGVSCDEMGLFVGEIPLLEIGAGGLWRPRPAQYLNDELSWRYDLPIEIKGKIGGLETIARALDEHDFARAQIATLHLRLPDPPTLAKSARSQRDALDLVRRLRASGLLKADWDSSKHPRWPAKSPDNVGGQFAPAGTPAIGGSGSRPPTESHSHTKPANVLGSSSAGVAALEVAAGGGPEDPFADLAAAATLAAGFAISQIRAHQNRSATTAAARGDSTSGWMTGRGDYEEECLELQNKDMINCQIVRVTKGKYKAMVCRQVANTRYAECLRDGPSGVRTPFYWGN